MPGLRLYTRVNTMKYIINHNVKCVVLSHIGNLTVSQVHLRRKCHSRDTEWMCLGNDLFLLN